MSKVINYTGGAKFLLDEAALIENKSTLSIYANSTVTKIHSEMFKGCTNLTQISLPNVSVIEDGAFQGCTGLTLVELPKTHTLGANAFQGCTALSLIAIFNSNNTQPNEATNFGATAFSGCTLLSSVYIGLNIPPILPASTVFTGTKIWGAAGNGKVFVPDAAVYKASAIWKLSSISNKIVASYYNWS